MKKVSILLVMLLCISANIFAQDFGVVNSDGKPIYYNITSSTEPRTVEVTRLPDEYWLYNEYKYAGVINIPESVTYNGNTYSVTSIGDSAFSFCSNLTSITIPNSVTSIGYRAFFCCYGLTSVTIPNSVTSIGDGAFDSCTDLTSITIPNSVTSIGYATFRGCSGLTSVTIPNSVTSIGQGAFYLCPLVTLRMKPENPPTIE
ncbi:MAG: leucine-rich repeat domain-containing protein, partial [Bacteroidales bacterium]|nr:leucine-rich repeat domain-containing protein [Candidatus Scybalousia scybalohippi]